MSYNYCEKCRAYSIDKIKYCPICGGTIKVITDLKKIPTSNNKKKGNDNGKKHI